MKWDPVLCGGCSKGSTVVVGRAQNWNSTVQRWFRLGSLLTGLVMVVLSFAVGVSGTTAQGAINLTVNGSVGPITVPVNTSLPILATGLTPLGTFTYTAYQGGDCGLGLVAAQDLEADAAGVWNWSSLSFSTPTTLWIRVSDGPNNSNCVQITWQTVNPTATSTPTPDPTGTATATIPRQPSRPGPRR